MAEDMSDPAPPPTQPPPSSFSGGGKTPSKSPYRSARQNELDALRQKGLTKIFNRHFTSAAEKIEQERKEAEKALQDIIKRKAELAANPKLFEKSGLTLTQLETLHQELQRRKHDVQRKEKETQELYKRYVSQYGGPTAPGSSSKDSLMRQMPVLHENIDTFRQQDLLLAKQSEKSPTVDIDVGLVGKNFEEGVQEEDLNSSSRPDVPQRTMPSYEVHSPSNSFTPIEHSKVNSSYYPESPLSPSSNPDGAPTSISGFSTGGPQDPTYDQNDRSSFMASPVPSVPSLETKEGSSSILRDVMVTNENRGSNEDSDSTLSGLTSIDGATVAEAEWRLTEFLKVESDNIRKMLAGSDDLSMELTATNSKDDSSAALTSAGSKAVTEATHAAEEMARKMEEATAWLKDPTLLQNDSEDTDDEKKDEENENEPQKEAKTKRKEKAVEWQAFWSASHEREYYYNQTTNQTCWSKPQGVEIDMSRIKEIKPEIAESKEDAVVVRDYTKTSKDSASVTSDYQTNEQLINEYRPDSDSITVRSSASVTKSSKVMEYRRKMKLKAKRRKKKIRAIAAIVALSSVGMGLYKTKERWMPLLGLQTQSQRLAELEKVRLETEKAALKQFEKDQKKKTEEKERQRKLLEKQEEERRRKEADARARKQAEMEKKRKEAEAAKKAKEEERRLAEIAAQKARDEKEREERRKKEEAEALERHRRELEAAKRAEEEQRRKEEEERRLRDELAERIREEERKKIQAELLEKKWRLEQERKENATQQNAVTPLKEGRNLQCNIPFAYLFSRTCRRKATKDPPFNVEAITDSMME